MKFHVNLIDRKDLSGEIYRQVRRAIAKGQLRPGDSLPATRELAHSLGVSRTTVTVAYERLAGECFIATKKGSGTFVSKHVRPQGVDFRASRPEGTIRSRAIWDSIPLSRALLGEARFELRTGLPDAALFPHDAWRRLLVSESQLEAKRPSRYGHPSGEPALREAIARHIAVSRGVQASAEDVTVTNGAQQALDVVARALLEPGDRVAVEDPGYLPPRFLFESLGAKVTGVRVDEEGIVVEEIPRRTRLVYVTPSHQYPLGVTMSLTRRLALLEWAARNGAAVIEDDYDTEFRFGGRPVEPLQNLDVSGSVIYVGSFSKSLLPSFRLGFVVTPRCCTSAVHKAKYVSDWHTGTVMQKALARFIDEGGFARHVRKLNRVYTERHELLLKILSEDFAEHLTVVPSVAGLHITAVAPKMSVKQVNDIVARAAELGVRAHELSRFSVDSPPRAGFVFGYGGIATRQIPEALRLLSQCFGD